jgi:Tol biopolymer transport system component/imidazolonepropionase-like amidohydrolase
MATGSPVAFGAEANDKDETDAAKSWSVETPPGPRREQAIDVDEATWVSVTVSPDGQEIVFDLLGDLYAMPITGADGTGGRYPEKLTSGMAWDMQPTFSHDGKWIAFTSDRDGKSKKSAWNIWTLNRETGETRQITNETYTLLNAPAWAPDDQYIVARKHFTSRRSLGAGEIWMYHHDAVAVDAARGLQLTKKPNDEKDVNEPVYSADGKYVYYSQDITPGGTFEYSKDSIKGIYAIKRLELETGETETVIRGPGGACRPMPSPDGRLLAFVRRVGAKTGLHVYDTKTGAIRLIYDKLERDMQETWAVHGVYPGFAWVPDGESIVLWAKGKIRRVNVADGAGKIIPFRIRDTREVVEALRFPIDVAPDEFDVRMLRDVQVAPDGKQVTYQTLGYIYVRDLPNGAPRRLTSQTEAFEFYPSYSRDGRSIVYTTWNDQTLGSVRVAPAQGGAGRAITSEPGHYTNPVFSPDGKIIVFEKKGGGSLTSALHSLNQGLYKIPTTGGEAELISKSGASPQFGADLDRVYLTTSERAKDADNFTLYSIDLAGNERRDHYKSKWGTQFRISADGQSVAFIERFNVYVAPFVKTGKAIDVGPDGKGLPTRRISRDAGQWIHFSGDGANLHWALGPELFTWSLGEPGVEDEESEGPGAANVSSTQIGFRATHDQPESKIALVGGRIITMGSRGEIANGVVLIEGNRIVSVGAKNEIKIPADAKVVDVTDQFILPGYIDTHAHGRQAANGMTPQQNWLDYTRLAFGVTTVHDPSNGTNDIFAASEMTKAGLITAPRTFSTGTILYGATGASKAEVGDYDDALFHLKRMQAVGAFSVKSYNQPRRDQRQKIVAAARELGMMVVPEGGSLFMNNMTMIVDGHTGIEHTLPVQTAYDDVMDLWRGTEVGYTPTLCVAYGGLWGENYWYQVDDLWLHPRLKQFIPPHVLEPRSRRRPMAPLEDYNHMRVAEITKQVVDDGGLVQAGGHGQLAGVCTHWEMWAFVQGGMTPLEALRSGTLHGAKYLGLDGDLGSIEAGKLADLVVIEPGADPTQNIRDSERVQLTIANGRVFHADTMAERDGEPAPEFFWRMPGHGLSLPLPDAHTCSCQVGGGQ